jgi:hypothetical protein
VNNNIDPLLSNGVHISLYFQTIFIIQLGKQTRSLLVK